MRIAIFGALVLALGFFSTSYGQLQKGDVVIQFDGSVQRLRDEIIAQANAGPSYFFTDRLFLGANVAVQKIPEFKTTYGLLGRLGYAFNMVPGTQKVVPVLGGVGGVAWGGRETIGRVGGGIDINMYASRSIGFTIGFTYNRMFPKYGASYNSLILAGGFFVQFQTGE